MGKFNELTHKELLVLGAHLNEFKEGCGGETLDDMLDDNYSWATAKNFQERTGLSKHQVAGLISSLLEKDAIIKDDSDSNLFTLNINWFEARFELSDNLIKLSEEALK